MAWTEDDVASYESVFGELTMDIDGSVRRSFPWPAWAITTRIDTSAYWRTTWEAASPTAVSSSEAMSASNTILGRWGRLALVA